MSFLGIDLDHLIRNFPTGGLPAQVNSVLKVGQVVFGRDGARVPIATHFAAQYGPRQRCAPQEWQSDSRQGSRLPGHDRRGNAR
jgi:hypothetical protein